ncbi:MAG TPA: hypothetical protein VHB97_11550 [Polyangia bacterium]|nr:hypothetical protein [Polyangia bacterium]
MNDCGALANALPSKSAATVAVEVPPAGGESKMTPTPSGSDKRRPLSAVDDWTAPVLAVMLTTT